MKQERKQIIEAPPNFKNKTYDRYDKPMVREVEDKLEKKKIMDEVQSEFNRINSRLNKGWIEIDHVGKIY